MNQFDSKKRASSGIDAKNLRDYHSDPVPIGSVSATLMGKSWGKSVNLLCYFTDDNTGSNFTISVFRSRENSSLYGASEGGVDFSEHDIIGRKYLLDIKKSPRAKYPSLRFAELVA